ncbi:MAG: DMT family transporter [Beijerinckiaceae bacterium]|nr:DMT family transporter [Beijerinckiaceae bacterium]
MLTGLLAGLAAGALWGLTFVAPNLVAPFTPFDLAFWRNLIFAALSLGLLLAFRAAARRLDPAGWRIALALGLMGYSGYYLFVAYAVAFAGPAIPALVIGALPVLLAIAGNWQSRDVAWSRLAVPLALITLGLVIVNLGSLRAPVMGRTGGEILLGFVLSLGGLALWLWYGLWNAAALKARPGTDTLVWTSLQGLGAGLGMLAVLPFGLAMGWSRMGALPLAGAEALPLWLWALATGLFSSWVATFAWVVASRRLSVALSAQLIVSETLFGLFYGFLAETRWPDWHEGLGAALLFAGVMAGIRVLMPPAEPEPSPA